MSVAKKAVKTAAKSAAKGVAKAVAKKAPKPAAKTAAKGVAKPASGTGAALQRYTAKRNFAATPEPPAAAAESGAGGPLTFVVQKHWASRLHYDFRLELDGVLVSWALPKGPSYDPADKRMAVHVEDHPVSYGAFEGTIPRGHYGAGRVIVWDHGHWEPVAPTADARAALAAGKLVFRLHGEKLAGLWELVRIAKPGDRQDPWMLFKKRDAWARPAAEYDVVSALPDSVIARPLGLVEERQPRAANGAAGSTGANGAASAAAISAPSGATTRRAADLPGAVAAATLPATLAPQLATAAAAPPARGEWIYELKFDGYRLLARIDGAGRVTLHTRNGHDWTPRLAPVAEAVAAAASARRLRNCWLDGEIVVQRDDGTPDFNALQNAIDSAGARGGGGGGRSAARRIRYFLFDAPFFDGHDLRRTPLFARRALLRQWFGGSGNINGSGGPEGDVLRFSADFAADPASLLESARTLGLEGLIAKRADAPYVSQRSDTWLKLKVDQRQELVIGGFTVRQGAAGEVGSLILGVHDDAGRLVHAGSVGTGWDGTAARRLLARLLPLEAKKPPFAAGSPDPGRWSRRAAGGERWVRPELVAEVRFTGWTPAGHVRHAVFIGLREDKPAREVTRERIATAPERPRDDRLENGMDRRAAQSAKSVTSVKSVKPANPANSARSASPPPAGPPPARRLKITHGERVIDATTGLTKLDLVRYYDSIAERMLPHLAGRPLALVRAPEGVGGQVFFQKHDEAGSLPGLKPLPAKAWPGHAPLLTIADADALLAAAQMNVVEFHTWNSTAPKVDRPDRVVFDLDPGEGVPFERVREAALLTRTLLEELGLESWLKTSGGKGLHVVVPITPTAKFGYDEVKDFAETAVLHLARTIPSRFVAQAGPANRVGRIFVDWLRNGFGATTAAAFSARARAGLGVSMPVAWDELSGLKSGAQWNIATAREHLSFQRDDPWAGYFEARQSLAKAARALPGGGSGRPRRAPRSRGSDHAPGAPLAPVLAKAARPR